MFNNIIAFIREISLGHDLDLGSFQRSLSDSFNEIISGLGKYVSDGAINIIGGSLGVISTIVISFSAGIYLLADMDKIRSSFKRYLQRKSKKAYQYFSILDHEMKSYLTGFFKIVVITLFEYTLTFYFIGHPNALLLGCLAAVASLIPYFGGMITNIIACITAFVTSPWLFFKTIIAKMTATKFLKKLFCIVGRSPESLTNVFISAKQNAETIIYNTPKCFLFIISPPL